MINLKTKHIVIESGERLNVLVDGATGVPCFYPNLFITSQIRGNSKSLATVQSFIQSMKVLYTWSVNYSIDIEERWAKSEWLKAWEVDSLRDHCGLTLSTQLGTSNKVVMLKKEHGQISTSVNSSTKYIRMTFIADYLKWLAAVLDISGSRKDRNTQLDAMYISFKSQRPKMRGLSEKAREEKGLPSALVTEILEVTRPGHQNNPYHGYPLQARNASIISLLHYLGIRRGELLNLRVDDIDFVANEIRIVRRADSPLDTRVYQPLVKTEGRILPINDKLSERLSEYVTLIRSTFPKARQHPYLFVTHKKGPFEGKPLSNSSFGKMMTVLQGVFKSFSQVHAHAFRHSWNYSFSKILDNSGNDQSPEKEEQMRSYLMGWKEASGTAAIYNRRHIKEKAKEAILDFQNNVGPLSIVIDEE